VARQSNGEIMDETLALVFVLLVLLGGMFVYWWWYIKPKAASVVTPAKTTSTGLPTFGNAKIVLSTNVTELDYNTKTGVLSHTIMVKVSNKGSDEADNVVVGIIVPDVLKYYVNTDQSGWTKENFTGILGGKGLYIYKDVLPSSQYADAEYTLALFPQVPNGTYTIYFVEFTLNGATEDSMVKLVPVKVVVSNQ